MASRPARNSSSSKNVLPACWSKQRVCNSSLIRGTQHVIGIWQRHFSLKRRHKNGSRSLRLQSVGRSKTGDFWLRRTCGAQRRKLICASQPISQEGIRRQEIRCPQSLFWFVLPLYRSKRCGPVSHNDTYKLKLARSNNPPEPIFVSERFSQRPQKTQRLEPHQQMATQLFVNLPVKDLGKSMGLLQKPRLYFQSAIH